MTDNKFNQLQDAYLQRVAKIQQTKENKEEEKLAHSPYLSPLVSLKYLFSIVSLKMVAHYANKRYLKAVERKKRFTLSMAGQSFWHRLVSKTLQGIFLGVMAIVIIFPFYWMIMTSFKPFSDVYPTLKETLWPKHWSLEAYEMLFKFVDNRGNTQTIPFTRYFGNTIYIALLSTLTQILVSTLGGFAIYNWKTKLNPIIMGFLFSLIMIPGEAMLLGRYIFAVELGWKDSVLSLIVPFIGNVYTIYLISSALSTTGKDLKQATKVDGLSTFKYFYKIALPAIKSVIITSMIISFIEAWNSTLWPVMIISSDGQNATIPMLLYSLIELPGGDISRDLSNLPNPTNFKMAASVLAIAPIMIMFLIFNKPIIKGISNRNLGSSSKG